MSGTGLRFWLAALAAPLLLSSCASYYKLEVGGLGAEYDRSVFLIVCTDPDIETTDEETFDDWVRLTTKDRISKYLLYAQFDAASGEALRWSQVNLVNKIPDMLTVEIGENEDLVTVTLNKALQEDYRQMRVIALTIAEDGTWLHKDADEATIRGRDALQLTLKPNLLEFSHVPAAKSSSNPSTTIRDVTR